jgi:CRISPR-associated RAMP protein (TIGR02581 family)
MTSSSFTFDRFNNRITLSGSLTTEGPLRIGAGRATELTGADLPVVRDSFHRPYIPGSSFKGALRSFIESLVRGVRDSKEAACNPVGGKDDWCLPQVEDLSDDLVERKLCLVCRVFGSPWWASKVSIRDMPVDESLWFGQFEQRNGVAIDRETETAADKKLYDFEVAPAGTIFKCEIVVENADDWELGLLMLGLRPFERGEAALGGARSRGLGVVKLALPSRTQIKGGEGLLDYLADEKSVISITDEVVKDWIKAFRRKLSELPAAQEGRTDA